MIGKEASDIRMAEDRCSLHGTQTFDSAFHDSNHNTSVHCQPAQGGNTNVSCDSDKLGVSAQILQDPV